MAGVFSVSDGGPGRNRPGPDYVFLNETFDETALLQSHEEVSR